MEVLLHKEVTLLMLGLQLVTLPEQQIQIILLLILMVITLLQLRTLIMDVRLMQLQL